MFYTISAYPSSDIWPCFTPSVLTPCLISDHVLHHQCLPLVWYLTMFYTISAYPSSDIWPCFTPSVLTPHLISDHVLHHQCLPLMVNNFQCDKCVDRPQVWRLHRASPGLHPEPQLAGGIPRQRWVYVDNKAGQGSACPHRDSWDLLPSAGWVWRQSGHAKVRWNFFNYLFLYFNCFSNSLLLRDRTIKEPLLVLFIHFCVFIIVLWSSLLHKVVQ